MNRTCATFTTRSYHHIIGACGLKGSCGGNYPLRKSNNRYVNSSGLVWRTGLRTHCEQCNRKQRDCRTKQFFVSHISISFSGFYWGLPSVQNDRPLSISVGRVPKSAGEATVYPWQTDGISQGLALTPLRQDTRKPFPLGTARRHHTVRGLKGLRRFRAALLQHNSTPEMRAESLPGGNDVTIAASRLELAGSGNAPTRPKTETRLASPFQLPRRHEFQGTGRLAFRSHRTPQFCRWRE